jgi:hypothetical protein
VVSVVSLDAFYDMNQQHVRSVVTISALALFFQSLFSNCEEVIVLVNAFQPHTFQTILHRKLDYAKNQNSNYYNNNNFRTHWNLKQSHNSNSRTSVSLHMAGGNKSLHKQAALRQKLQQAKQQNIEQLSSSLPDGTLPSSSSSSSLQQQKQLSDQEIRERNDRLRFEELLQKGAGTTNLLNDDEYKSKQQLEDEIDAVRK